LAGHTGKAAAALGWPAGLLADFRGIGLLRELRAAGEAAAAFSSDDPAAASLAEVSSEARPRTAHDAGDGADFRSSLGDARVRRPAATFKDTSCRGKEDRMLQL
jgi:hypothetical protein